MMGVRMSKEHACFGGRQGYYAHDSEACRGEMTFSVFLPPHALRGDTLLQVPALVFLSGLTCTEDNVTVKAGAQRIAAELGMAVVAPDTSPRGQGIDGEDDSYDLGTGAGFYVDATQAPWSSAYRMFTYVTEELPAVLAANFPIDISLLGITGHSMGGHGALVLGLRRPDLFRTVSAFSPIVAPSRVPWGQKAFTAYLGQDSSAWKSYDATELVAAGKRVRGSILIDQGTADGFLADQLQPEHFERACAQGGQPLELRRQEGYDHSYFFIATFIEDHLRHHHRGLLG